jgi:hypothetical protein
MDSHGKNIFEELQSNVGALLQKIFRDLKKMISKKVTERMIL